MHSEAVVKLNSWDIGMLVQFSEITADIGPKMTGPGGPSNNIVTPSYQTGHEPRGRETRRDVRELSDG